MDDYKLIAWKDFKSLREGFLGNNGVSNYKNLGKRTP